MSNKIFGSSSGLSLDISRRYISGYISLSISSLITVCGRYLGPEHLWVCPRQFKALELKQNLNMAGRQANNHWQLFTIGLAITVRILQCYRRLGVRVNFLRSLCKDVAKTGWIKRCRVKVQLDSIEIRLFHKKGEYFRMTDNEHWRAWFRVQGKYEDKIMMEQAGFSQVILEFDCERETISGLECEVTLHS